MSTRRTGPGIDAVHGTILAERDEAALDWFAGQTVWTLLPEAELPEVTIVQAEALHLGIAKRQQSQSGYHALKQACEREQERWAQMPKPISIHTDVMTDQQYIEKGQPK